jgi:Kdo2-lipid IVA lauroyltransferase/acyltransferase
MYYIVYGFLYLVSLLPLSVLYLLSDLVYGLIFYVFKYRKAVVMANLLQAFPEKTEKERQLIAKKFYRNLTDTFIETIKMLSVSKEYINKHCSGDYSLFHRFNNENKICQVHPCHHFNWEWINSHFALNMPQTFLAVYMQLSSKIFEKLFFIQRSRFGSVMIPANNMREGFMPWRKKLHVLGLVADQNPGHPGNAYWVNFFNKPTPFVKGPEKAARDKKCPVIFAFITKPRRGYYHCDFFLASEDVSQMKEGELTKLYVAMLTKNITEHPENWLWSHRRWKWEWKPEYGEIIN